MHVHEHVQVQIWLYVIECRFACADDDDSFSSKRDFSNYLPTPVLLPDKVEKAVILITTVNHFETFIDEIIKLSLAHVDKPSMENGLSHLMNAVYHSAIELR
ncbi:hypothetical protein DINM_002132 [Dirofilaria immitis]|nr:hypothetical protein [Dirofilaria immitis]